MKIKVAFFLFVFTLLLSVNSNVLSEPKMESSNLETRIHRIENGLLLQSKDEPSNLQYNLRDRMKFYSVPGVSIAVINKGKIDWARGYGVKEAEGNNLIDSKTLFQAASISKPIAATAVMKLVQQGRLDLDEDVNQKLASWQIPESNFTQEKKVTLRNILSHTVGLTIHGFEGYTSEEALPTLLQILNGEKPANSDEVKKVVFSINK